jgi:acyl-CoA synthetase (AMP-forming)/AMP-acid ligase II
VRRPGRQGGHHRWLARAADVGYRDVRNCPFIKDRLEDVVITGGFNLHPRDGGGIPLQHSTVFEAVLCNAGIGLAKRAAFATRRFDAPGGRLAR